MYQKDTNLVSRRVAGELILVPIRGSVGDLEHIYSFNPVGTRIWELLDSAADIDHIVQVLTEEFSDDTGRIKNDVEDFLAELESQGFIKNNE